MPDIRNGVGAVSPSDSEAHTLPFPDGGFGIGAPPGGGGGGGGPPRPMPGMGGGGGGGGGAGIDVETASVDEVRRQVARRESKFGVLGWTRQCERLLGNARTWVVEAKGEGGYVRCRWCLELNVDG